MEILPCEPNGVEEEEVPKFLELQECYNICMAAYKEVMSMAVKAHTWVGGVPALGSIEELQEMLRAPSSPGMVIEYSVESAIVPAKMDHLVSVMMDVDEWSSVFCDIVHNRTVEVPTGVMIHLTSNRQTHSKDPHRRDNFRNVKTIDAELLFPMPCMSARKFSFVRFMREVIPEVWAIVDVSTDYFPNLNSTLEVNCKRRPSGVIIRRRDDCSEVIWIENMEVQKDNDHDSKYSGVINSNLAFSAKHWISTLMNKLKRNESQFVINKTLRNFQAFSVRAALLQSTQGLKNVFLNYTTKHLDETKWHVLSNERVKILKDTQGKDYYMAVTSFRVEATPLSVFNSLVKRNLDFLWPNPNLHESEEPEEVIKLASDDGSNCITLHSRSVMQTEAREIFYLLQEASRDEFRSFIISSRLTQSEVGCAFGYEKACYPPRPFGFSIVPDGAHGLQSDASLVTICLQQKLDADLETGEAVSKMNNLVRRIVGVMNVAAPAGEEEL